MLSARKNCQGKRSLLLQPKRKAFFQRTAKPRTHCSRAGAVPMNGTDVTRDSWARVVTNPGCAYGAYVIDPVGLLPQRTPDRSTTPSVAIRSWKLVLRVHILNGDLSDLLHSVQICRLTRSVGGEIHVMLELSQSSDLTAAPLQCIDYTSSMICEWENRLFTLADSPVPEPLQCHLVQWHSFTIMITTTTTNCFVYSIQCNEIQYNLLEQATNVHASNTGGVGLSCIAIIKVLN